MADWTPPTSDADWTPPASDSKYEPGMILQALKNFQHAATLGYDDKINAALQAGLQYGPGKNGATFGDRYNSALATNQGIQKQVEQNPWLAIPSQVAGNFMPGTIIGKATNTLAKGAVGLIPAIGRNMVGGAVQGGIQGAGEATTPSEILPNAVSGATFGGAVGAAVPTVLAGAEKVIPKVASAVSNAAEKVIPKAVSSTVSNAVNKVASTGSELVKNYRSLSPEVTGSVGPIVYGGLAGAAAPSIAGLNHIPNPLTITPEDWSSDPLSALAKTATGGLVGMAGGKVVKTLGQTGGAIQKTFGGSGPTGLMGGGSGGPVPPSTAAPAPAPAPAPAATSIAPAAPIVITVKTGKPTPVPGTENAPAEVQRQAAMKQISEPGGRAQTNSESPAQTRQVLEIPGPRSSQKYFNDLKNTTLADEPQTTSPESNYFPPDPKIGGPIPARGFNQPANWDQQQLVEPEANTGTAALGRFGQSQRPSNIMGMEEAPKESSVWASSTPEEQDKMDAIAKALRQNLPRANTQYKDLRKNFQSTVANNEQMAKDNGFDNFGEYLEKTPDNSKYKLSELMSNLPFTKGPNSNVLTRDEFRSKLFGTSYAMSEQRQLEQSGMTSDEALQKALGIYKDMVSGQ